MSKGVNKMQETLKLNETVYPTKFKKDQREQVKKNERKRKCTVSS